MSSFDPFLLSALLFVLLFLQTFDINQRLTYRKQLGVQTGQGRAWTLDKNGHGHWARTGLGTEQERALTLGKNGPWYWVKRALVLGKNGPWHWVKRALAMGKTGLGTG